MKSVLLWLFAAAIAFGVYKCIDNNGNSNVNELSDEESVTAISVDNSSLATIVVDTSGYASKMEKLKLLSAKKKKEIAARKKSTGKPDEKTYKSKSSPSHVSESTSSESAASLRKQFEALTDERYEIFNGLCEEYGIIGLFYIGSNNKLNIMVSDPGKDTRSEDELMYIAKGISEVVRTFVYQDKGVGGEDSELLHKVNPTFKVSIIGEDLKNETIELKLEETYN